MLARVDGIDTDIAALDAQIETHLAPFAPDAVRLDEIPGIGPGRGRGHHRRDRRGHDQVPHPWAPLLVGEVRTRVKTSAGRNKGNGSTGHGNRDLGVRAARRELIAFAVRMR
jgi:transposase